MGLYNFNPMFAQYVREGSKCHTIRAKRANPDKPGNTVHLYIGLRHKSVELLGRHICTKVEEITITEALDVIVDGIELTKDEKNALAWADGFRGYGRDQAFAEMMQFWEGRLPFVGDIIHWRWTPKNVEVKR
jgi:hypothetical protein